VEPGGGGVTSTDVMTAVPVAQAAPIDALAVDPVRESVAVVEAPRRRADFTWLRTCLAVDTLMLGAAVAVAELGAPRAGITSTPRVALVAFPLLVIALLWARRLYQPRLALRFLDEARAILVATTIAAMALASINQLFTSGTLADNALRMWAFGAVFLMGGRVVLTWSEVAARRSGAALRPTLIIGAGRVGAHAAKRLLAHPELGLKPVGFLDRDPLASEVRQTGVPILGASWDLEAVVKEQGIEQVIVTFSKAPHEVLLRLVRRCDELGVRVAFVPRLFDRMTERVSIEHLGAFPLLIADVANPKSWQFVVKHAIDRLLALTALVLLAPLMIAAAIGVRVSGPGPILFRQTRVGRDGRTFELLKFRTMRDGSSGYSTEDLPFDTAPGGVVGDDFRTPFGEFLRRSSIDELPQLFNVLRGEMSLVGPRPERPEFATVFELTVSRYEDRHRVKSGITGWAQVHGLRGKTSISERAELDAYYVQNWSLWLDVKIFLMTVLAVIRSYRSVE
jgi:exopolysaccharide biosynthesis polyprenyl glycosylphosphotransferase